MKIDKEKLKDSGGRPLTQSLFLELGYNTDFAVYTMKDEDYEYKGKVYPSLKRLYLEAEDPIEYMFATTYLLGWSHWQRICKNKRLSSEIDDWRFELELKLRSQSFQDILEASTNEKGFQAAKWIADRGWEVRGAGRPTKEAVKREAEIQNKIEEEYSADIVRLSNERY